MILRILSPLHGTKRIEVEEATLLNSFFEKLNNELQLGDFNWNLFYDQKKERKVVATSSRTSLKTVKLKHGDMLYLSVEKELHSDAKSSVIVEDAVDQELEKLDGRIQRKRDPQLCRHPPNGRCIHCSILEPFDEEYLKSLDPPIKHLSFNSYIRKLKSGVDKGRFANLENISCKIRDGCTGHPPWPDGICTKCQPSAITLNLQSYRHVDYVQFENKSIVDRLIDFWRISGGQRLGFLYGTYEAHEAVPLGIKASVCAIYEPPQINSGSSIALLEDPLEETVNWVAKQMGLVQVGWVFTDLVTENPTKGTVIHVRNSDAHLLSAEECITAGMFQNQHPNPCKHSSNGFFGSKFVTVCITGDKNNQIHLEAYQVSNQCQALVGDNCIIPTKDAPELAYVKESTNKQYLPDVFYKQTDEYGNVVMLLARPLPIEYLIIDVPAGIPKQPIFTFPANLGNTSFPVENRQSIDQTQDLSSFSSYMKQFENDLLGALSDFHMLLYLALLQVVHLKDDMPALLSAVIKHDHQSVNSWCGNSENWKTLVQLASMQGTSQTGQDPASGIVTDNSQWQCNHCTFLNLNNSTSCEMCNLPKN